MKAYFVILINLLSIVNSFGQEIILKGRVIDQKTKEPIVYSIIEIKALKTGTYTDSNGGYSITIKNLNDTVEFYSLGYEKQKFKINDLNILNDKTIELKPRYINLKEVVVVPHKEKIIRLGITSKKPWQLQIANTFGGQYGHYISNKYKKEGYVKAVSFYIAKVGFQNAPFRIRIYGKDQLNDCPGLDLLNENVIISNTKGEGWFTVDISKYDVNFPTDGMYVMMEWVYSGDQFYYTYEHEIKTNDGKSTKKTYHVYGQSLGNVMKQPDGGYWCKGLGDKWNRMNAYYKGYVNVMINADIAFQTK